MHPALGDAFQILHNTDKDCASHYQVEGDSGLVLFRKFDSSPIVYSGAFEAGKISEWVGAATIPTLLDYSTENSDAYQKMRGSPIIILFRKKEDVSTAWHKAFEEAATALKGQFYFVVSGIKERSESQLAGQFGVNDADLPTLRIFTFNNGRKFIAPLAASEISTETITQLGADFKAGKIEFYQKSEPIPAANSDPVKVVVGKSFTDIVLAEGTDVLMEFYAPWCGHCKKLAPIYDQLAKDLADIPNLVIAKMDATANEVDGV